MIQLDLRREGSAYRPTLPALAVDDADRGLAMRTWRARMVNEHISARVFAALVPQLMEAGLPSSVQRQLPVYIADEYRHAEQCAGVVLALGGVPVAPLPELPPVPDHEDAGPLETVLRNLLSICCLSETVAVAVIRAEQATLEGTALGEVLGSILADEVQHARFGWEVLGTVAPSLDEPMRRRLSAYLTIALDHLVAYELPKLPVLASVSPEAEALGVCDGGLAREIFFATLHEVILPQLDAAGLFATEAWQATRAHALDGGALGESP